MMESSKVQPSDSKKRVLFSQSDFPQSSLEVALRIPTAILDHYAGHPTSPLNVALALNISPSSSNWRYLPGSATAYGLTKGSYRADQIEITMLGRRILSPSEPGGEIKAQREAIMKPSIMKAFYEKYNGARFPDDNIAGTVLMGLGLPKEKVPGAVKILRDNARLTGILREANSSLYIDLGAAISTIGTSLEHKTDIDEADESLRESQVDVLREAAISKGHIEKQQNMSQPTLHIDIQIHISSEASPAQIDQIFASMAKHLYGKN